MRSALVWILSCGLSLVGLIGSVGYLWWHYRQKRRAPRSPLAGHRPWRPVGAVLCAVVSALFYVGLHHLDATRRPGLFLAWWAVILLLLAALCVMAVVDVLYTRRLIRPVPRRPDRTG